MFKHVEGNIFNSNKQVIVNTVNCVGVMGKGIALECKLRYPEMFKAYKKYCDQKKLLPGTLQLWKNSDPWILNFPTKIHWKDPSKFEYLEKGLDKFINTYNQKGIKSISFPLLGASLGGLPEDKVFQLMKNRLENIIDLDVEVYKFDPNVEDDLFVRLKQKVKKFSIEEYKINLKIKNDAAKYLKNAIDNNQISSMLSIQDVPKIGVKSLENIHKFLNLNTKSSIQKQHKLDLV